MEARTLAHRIVTSSRLEDKIQPPGGPVTDARPGEPLRIDWPGRPRTLRIVSTRTKVKVPPLEGMGDPSQRARILNALANHELQAAELYAWALLAFADAPAEFRRDLLSVLDDEQRHTRMYIARLEATGGHFGDWPVTGYFWNKVEGLTSPLRFVCAMALTFENANLDHAADGARAAREAGDDKTARVIEAVGRDEIEHVRIGWRWLLRLKRPDETPWQAYQRGLAWPLHPARARGRKFRVDPRVAAGLDRDFIRQLEATHP